MIKERMNLKEKRITMLLCLLVIILITPYIISISNSVLSGDDFGMAFKEFSLSKCFEGAKYFYYNWGGGFPFAFVQYLLNPLHFSLPHNSTVGLFLVSTFILFIMTLYFLIRCIMKQIFYMEGKIISFCIFVVLLFAILNSSVYPEIYYWYVGNSYLWVLVLIIWDIYFIIQYFNTKKTLLRCISLSLLGFIACFSIQNAVWAGITYLFLWFRNIKNDNRGFAYNGIPLAFMILGGLISALAPGNFARHDKIDSSGLHISNAMLFALKNMAKIMKDIITNPLCFLCIALLFIIGVLFVKSNLKIKPIILWLLAIPAIYCIIFPLALGYSSDLITNRQLFVISMPMIIIGGICVLYTGTYYRMVFIEHKWFRRLYPIVCVIGIVAGSFISHTTVDSIPWIKTVKNIDTVIKENHFYNNILYSLANTDEESVIIQLSPGDIPSPSGLITESIDVSMKNEWINGPLKEWFEKKDITVIVN